MTFLLDTNVVSEIRKPQPDPSVVSWQASTPPESRFLSVLVFGEVRNGIERLRHRDPRQVVALERWMGRLRVQYRGRILPVTIEIAEEWGRLNARNPLAPFDGLMAATARVNRLTFVTRNTAHFAPTGVGLLNPFEPQ